MNAVATKPRAKAAPKASKPAAGAPRPETTIADVCSWIVTADRKLEHAYDAAESGEYIEKMLEHIGHSMMLEPLRLIGRERFTQFDASRVFEGLFPVLAVLHGAVKIAEGSVIHHTLTEAFQLLDNAQEALDPTSSAVRVLPVDDDHVQVTKAENAAFQATGIEENAYFMISEVIAIIRARAPELDSDLPWASIYVAEFAEKILGEGVSARNVGMCEDASGPMAVAITVLQKTLEVCDDVALHGAMRLLKFTKASLDAAVKEAS